MKPVKDILKVKGSHIWSIGPDATVYDAIKLMAEKKVGALTVLEDQKLIGIISERDYSRKVMLKGRSSRKTPVKSIMTSPVICTDSNQDIKKCMTLMTSKHIRHLPVIESDKLIGVVSLGDLVKLVFADQESKIRNLEGYFLYRSDLSRQF